MVLSTYDAEFSGSRSWSGFPFELTTSLVGNFLACRTLMSILDPNPFLCTSLLSGTRSGHSSG